MRRGAGAEGHRSTGAEGRRCRGRRGSAHKERPEGTEDAPPCAFPETLGKAGKGGPAELEPQCARRSRSKGSSWKG